MTEQYINILERIHASYYQLSAAERKVADYVLSQHTQVQFMSITQLADECTVAEATVSRFCRSLGLKGFNAFKLEMARHVATASAGMIPPRRIDAGSLEGRCMEAARLTQEAIQQTIELVQPNNIEQAVALIENAGKVLCVGSGGSMVMAQECAHLFSTVTNKFVAVTDSHMQMSAAATMNRGEVIVLFSYSGATTGGIQLLEVAKSRDIRTVLVTRFNKSPAAKLADVVLRCGSNEGPFQFGSVPAKIAQLIVMDVLFQEYRHRNQEKCEEHIQNIASALSGMHV